MQIEREPFESWMLSLPDDKQFNIHQGEVKDQPGCIACNFLRDTIRGFGNAGYISARVGEEAFIFDNWLCDLIKSFYEKGRFTAKDLKARYLELFPDTDFSPITDSGIAGVPTESSKGDRTTVIGG